MLLCLDAVTIGRCFQHLFATVLLTEHESPTVVLSGHDSATLVLSEYDSATVVLSEHDSATVVLSEHDSATLVLSALSDVQRVTFSRGVNMPLKSSLCHATSFGRII
jgi:mannitol-1-phosphate/altronate dehydrogenase